MSADHYPNNGATAVFVPKQLVKRVRGFVQDFAEVNELFEGEETANETIARYVADVVAAWNVHPPIDMSSQINPISLVMNPALAGVAVHIVNATSARVLKSVMFKLARNDMPYTAGNTSVQPNSVWRNLQPMIQDLEIQFREFRDAYKIQKNTEGAYGASHSQLYVGYIDERHGYVVSAF